VAKRTLILGPLSVGQQEGGIESTKSHTGVYQGIKQPLVEHNI